VIQAGTALNLSGDRFVVTYHVPARDEAEAREAADFIRVEETIEFPLELVAPGEMRDGLVGQIVAIEARQPGRYQVEISYAVEATGFDLPQTLNIIFGNVSFVPHIQVARLDFPERFLQHFKGPRFGRSGIRQLLGVYHRPLVSTALKPIGLDSGQLAEMAYQCALGGIDIIKDDHGLSHQRFAPFVERTERIVEAVGKANEETGRKSLYFANLSGPVERISEMARFAKAAGVDGLMLLPGLYGLDLLRMLAEDDSLGLAMICHPGVLGTYRISADTGISPFVLHGQLSRLCGADITIFPHYAGRFAPPREASGAAAEGTAVKMGALKPNLPCPGGGVKPESFAEMKAFYGPDAVFLAAGNLHRYADDLVEASRAFREMVETI